MWQSMPLSTEDMLADLRRQHLAFERAGYDGHNRRSGLVTTHRLAIRRRRRSAKTRLSRLQEQFNHRGRQPTSGPVHRGGIA